MAEAISARLAANIRHLREARGLTQEQMARLAGIPRATWGHLETGAGNPTLAVLDKVATALEGMEWTTLSGDHVVMRKDDHQLLMPIYISVHTNKSITYDLDNSGFGLSLESKVEREMATQPAACKMDRPT